METFAAWYPVWREKKNAENLLLKLIAVLTIMTLAFEFSPYALYWRTRVQTDVVMNKY